IPIMEGVEIDNDTLKNGMEQDNNFERETYIKDEFSASSTVGSNENSGKDPKISMEMNNAQVNQNSSTAHDADDFVVEPTPIEQAPVKASEDDEQIVEESEKTNVAESKRSRDRIEKLSADLSRELSSDLSKERKSELRMDFSKEISRELGMELGMELSMELSRELVMERRSSPGDANRPLIRRCASKAKPLKGKGFLDTNHPESSNPGNSDDSFVWRHVLADDPERVANLANSPNELPAMADKSAPGPSVRKPVPSTMKIGVAFDYMRVKVGEIAHLEKFTPALLKLYETPDAKEKDDEDIEGAAKGNAAGNGGKLGQEASAGKSGKKVNVDKKGKKAKGGAEGEGEKGKVGKKAKGY
ncbi:hypothetical protein MMC12_008572, partial [Toensbergia leucococca]|nr:hypothetical protein [Toensbergia leucococca]